MNDPTQYGNVGEAFVMDEEERQRTLSNEQIEAIDQRANAAQEQSETVQQESMQPATAEQTEPTEPETQPTGEKKTEEQGFFDLSGVGQGLTYFGQPIGETNTQVKERLSAPGQGLIDFGTQFINAAGKLIMRDLDIPQIPTATKYEDQVADLTRSISSVVAPTILLQGAGMSAGQAAQARVGSKLGQTEFMKFVGARGVEAASSVIVGSVSSEYEGDNFFGQIKKSIPAQYDFIPDNWATLDTDSTDEKRIKNINEDLALGFLIPFVGFAGKLGAALDETGKLFKASPEIIGETDQAIKRLAEIAPPPKSADVEEVLAEYVAKQTKDLDELGYYNMSKNADANVPMKGVHDLYDFRETGMRSVDDFGIVGASIDAARIAGNKGTVYGRLGNFISEPALKYGLETPGGVEEITIGLTKQLKDADRYRMDAADWAISFDEITTQGDNLVVELFDPSASVDDIKRLLGSEIKTNEFGVETLTEEGYSSALRSINKMVGEYSGMDVARAQAYTATSMAGQISDLSEGARINRGSISVDTAREKIRDNLAFLQQLVGSTKYYATQKRGLLAMGERIKNFGKSPEQIAKSISESYPQALKNIQSESDKFTESWEWLQTNRPDILDSFLELYELSDGKINTIAKMNEDILNSFVRWRPLLDGNPDAPNIMAQAVRSNYYNSLLSSGSTAAKALYGNLSGLIAEPVSYFGGAILRQDLKSLQRGWMAYNAIFDTQKKAIPYAGNLFTKASQNPNSVKGQTRLDLVIKQETKLDQYRYIAQQEALRGNHGFKFLVDQYEQQMAMASDPVFRLVPNLFTGFDGWTGATLANAQARFRAMDELDRLGEAVSPARVKELADVEYNKMFDNNGIVVDQAVKYSNADIALNLDTGLNKQLDGLLKYLPGLTPFLTFPTTMANMVRVADDYLPAPLRSFQRDVNDLAYTSVQSFMKNPELMDDILSKRGHKISQMDGTAKLNTLIDLKNRTLGKKAIGTFVTTLAIGTILKDKLFGDGFLSITGDGSVDRQLNRARQKNSSFKTRSVVASDGTRVEYDELLGPGLSNWVAMVANIADNFDMLGESATEHFFEKASFILAASLTDQAGISALRPLVELMSGNKQQMTRFAAGQINSLGPLGGARNELGRILDGGLKELNNDIIEHIANRNQVAGVIDNSNRLPTVISPVSGEAPNKYNMYQRIYNVYSPLKIHPSMTKEEKFLYEIEYDVSSAFRTRNGVDLEADERAELSAIMGKDGAFRRDIARIMKIAESRDTVKELREARRLPNLLSSERVPISKYDQIHIMLSEAQKQAEEAAFFKLDITRRGEIEQRINIKRLNDENAELGIIPTTRY